MSCLFSRFLTINFKLVLFGPNDKSHLIWISHQNLILNHSLDFYISYSINIIITYCSSVGSSIAMKLRTKTIKTLWNNQISVVFSSLYFNYSLTHVSTLPNTGFSLVSGWEQCSVVCVVRTRMGLVSKETVMLPQWEIDEQELLSLSTEVLII